MVADQVQTARAVACPFVAAHDVWVSDRTGERWVIQGKQEVATMKGKPLIYNVEMRLADPSSVVYDVPLTGSGSSSSS